MITFLVLLASASASPNVNTVLNVYGTHPQSIPFLSYLFPIPHHKPTTANDVYQGPVVILADATRYLYNSSEDQQSAPQAYSRPSRRVLTALYASNGLKSLTSNIRFRPFYEYFRQFKHLSGLAFTPTNHIRSTFLRNFVDQEAFTDFFSVDDLLKRIAIQDVQVLYVAPPSTFDQYGFTNIFELGTFSLNDNNVILQSNNGETASNTPMTYAYVPIYVR